MTTRRLMVGLLVVSGLATLFWVRPGAKHAQAQTPNTVYAAGTVESGGNEDEAAARFRAGGSRHWRQIMIGHR